MPTQIITPRNLSQLTTTVREQAPSIDPSTVVTERITRGLAARLLRGAGRRPARATLPSSEVRRVLILLPYAIGDYVVATPLFEWLHRAAPHASVDIVVSRVTRGLADADPRFDRVGVIDVSGTDAEMIAQLSSFVGDSLYDVVYAPTVHNMTRAMRLARVVNGSPIIVGTEQQRRNDVYRQFFDHLIPHYYPLQHWCDSYVEAGPLAIECASPITVTPFLGGFNEKTSSSQQHQILLNVSAKESKRTISTEKAVEVIAMLLQEQAHTMIRVSAAPTDTHRLQEILQRVPDDRVEGVHGDLSDVVDAVGEARVVISPDTSIVHIASCVGTPVVGLYLEPHKVVEWGPYRVQFRALISESATSLAPITAAEISTAAHELLQELEGSA